MRLNKTLPGFIKKIAKRYINDVRNFLDIFIMPFESIKLELHKMKWLSPKEMSEYKKKIKVYDVFTFFNELELLEIRLSILDEYVDYFVIIEATETFSGIPKKLFYAENKERFDKWNHKIIHFVNDTTPKNRDEFIDRLKNEDIDETERYILEEALRNKATEGGEQWIREFYQKESTRKALVSLKDDDFCYISDLDEIWNPDSKLDYSQDVVYRFKQKPYSYFLNNRSNENWRGWTGTRAMKYKIIKESSINDLRNKDSKGLLIQDGGWHFTNQGGVEFLKKKLESYGHQEYNTDEVKSLLDKRMKNNEDFIGRNFRFFVDEKDLPIFLKENKQKYKHLFR